MKRSVLALKSFLLISDSTSFMLKKKPNLIFIAQIRREIAANGRVFLGFRELVDSLSVKSPGASGDLGIN